MIKSVFAICLILFPGMPQESSEWLTAYPISGPVAALLSKSSADVDIAAIDDWIRKRLADSPKQDLMRLILECGNSFGHRFRVREIDVKDLSTIPAPSIAFMRTADGGISTAKAIYIDSHENETLLVYEFSKFRSWKRLSKSAVPAVLLTHAIVIDDPSNINSPLRIAFLFLVSMLMLILFSFLHRKRNDARKGIVIAFVSFVLLVANGCKPSESNQAEIEPIVQIKVPVIDLGELGRQENVAFDVELEVGDYSGKVISVRPSCACIQPAFDLESAVLARSSVKQLDFTLGTGSLTGDRQYNVKVFCELDGIKAEVVFSVVFYIRPVAWAMPEQLDLVCMPGHPIIKKKVWIALGRDLESPMPAIDYARSDWQGFEIKEVNQETVSGFQKHKLVVDRWELELTVDSSSLEKAPGLISVVFNNETGELRIPVSLETKPYIEHSPKSLFLGVKPMSSVVEKEVTLKNWSEQDIEVVINCSMLLAEPVQFSIPRKASRSLKFSMTVPEKTGRFETSLDVSGDCLTSTIKIPVSWVAN